MRKWLAIALVALSVAGCARTSQDLLTDVHTSAPPASPEVRAPGNRVDVQYLLVTTDGRLRQPAYRGVRTDLEVTDLIGKGDA